MWEINNNLQLLSFLYSCVLGFIFEIFYDLFRALRIVKPHNNLAVFFEDIIFFLIIAIASFIFLLSVTNGEIRAYIILGIIIGFMLFYRFVSRWFLKFLNLLFCGLFKLTSWFSKGFYWLFSKIDKIISEFLKNTLKILKKVLKNNRELLYTNRK